MMALTLVTLPAEILSNILQWVNPADLGKIPQTCRTLHVFVRDNKLLFKAVYCQSLVGNASTVKTTQFSRCYRMHPTPKLITSRTWRIWFVSKTFLQVSRAWKRRSATPDASASHCWTHDRHNKYNSFPMSPSRLFVWPHPKIRRL